MGIRIRYLEGCPGVPLARERLERVLTEAGRRGEPIGMERVETPADAERLGFRGSPTILVDERDPFIDEDAPVGFSCRVYRTESGMERAPSLSQLRGALGQ